METSMNDEKAKDIPADQKEIDELKTKLDAFDAMA